MLRQGLWFSPVRRWAQRVLTIQVSGRLQCVHWHFVGVHQQQLIPSASSNQFQLPCNNTKQHFRVTSNVREKVAMSPERRGISQERVLYSSHTASYQYLKRNRRKCSGRQENQQNNTNNNLSMTSQIRNNKQQDSCQPFQKCILTA